ncbi:DNA-binding pseudobarrel domain-containing protein, partial [Tanacetum coccineum]
FKVVDDEVSVFDDDDVEDELEDDDDVEKEDDDVEYDVEEEDEDVAEEDEEDDVDVELGDDDEEEDGEDEDDVDVDGDDGDPFFVITSSKRNKNNLRFPPDLVAMAKIKTKETITLKNDDEYEKEMPVRSYKQNKSTRYYMAEGWEEFQRSNNISEGDECVLKFITSEDKLCLAKVTKKKPRATEVDNDDDGMDEEGEAEDAKEDDSNVDGDDIFDDDANDEGKGENAKFVNDDEDDEDDDRDVDGDDGDPSFILTISDKNRYVLRFSADFVALAGINTKKTITLKILDGYEKKLRVRSFKRNWSKSYFLSVGWKEFQRNSNISEGDKFVFKFIKSERKFCLEKITKKKTRARTLPPAAEAPVTQVDDGMDDQDVDDNDDMDDDDGMDEEGEAKDAKEDDSNVDGDDIFNDDADDEGKGENAKFVNDDEDDEDDDRDADGDDGDPSFILTSTEKNQYHLWFKADFVALAGIHTKKTITLKNLDGYEKKLRVRSRSGQSYGGQFYRQTKWKNYYLAAGWKEFQRNSNISEGDRFVFKFITSEDKFCVAKITKNKTRARPLPPVVKAPVTEVDDGMDDKDVDDNDVTDVDDNDVTDVDEDVELFDDGNPSFVATITPTYNHVLRMPAYFARLARLDTKKTLTLKSLDGYEKEMPLRVEKCKPARYYVGSGWKDILQSTSISQGDKCVFKFIASEDKLCLAKSIKKQTQARPQLPVAEAQEKEFNDVVVEDDNDKDENEDTDVDDADPFFVVDITTCHKFMLDLLEQGLRLRMVSWRLRELHDLI